MRTDYFTILAVLLVTSAAPVVFGQSTCVSCQNCPIGNETAPMSCTVTEDLGCYRSEMAGGTVNRGCASDLTLSQMNECQRSDWTNCRICTGDSCNAQEDFTRCFRCDSSTGLGCTAAQISNVNTQVCPQFIDECATMIYEQRTVRGCLSDLAEMNPCTDASTCSSCSSNFCNGAIFPEDRLQCHHCDSNNDQCFNVIVGEELQRPCENYKASIEQCYTALDANNQVFRGCGSDTAAGVAACAAGRCEACTTQGCNNNATRWAPTLSCVSCAANDVLCGWGFAQTSATACTSNVLLGEKESCFTRVTQNGNVVRGCMLDNPADACDEPNCTTCDGNGCNRFTLNKHHCYQCTSDSNDSCRDRAKEDLESKPCPGDDHQLAERGCFTSVGANGNVKRGCIRDLIECSASDRCILCRGDGCNDIPGGAMELKMTVSVALAAVVALCANIV